jgi:glycosyltransferase involved in cell wall biosynthesis
VPTLSAQTRSMPPSICFVGLANLPVLAPEYGSHGVGGAQLQQTLLAKALVRRGFRVSMVVADYGQRDGESWDGVQTFKAYAADAGLPVLRFVHPRWSGLRAAMKRANADIYYVACAGALVGQVAQFTRQHGRKLVFRIASDSDCDPKTVLVKYWRDRQLYRYGLARADLILAQTATQQRALQESFGHRSRIAASLADVGGRRLTRAERDIDVIWVGNLQPLKRPAMLLEIARALPNLSFHMVGGPMAQRQDFFDSIREQARQIPNVTFHGPVPYHEIGTLYERARLLAATSETEGFPNTYLQAWGRGAPVVGFLDPDELIARHGLGAAVATQDEMRAAIDHLSADEAAWHAASARCGDFMDQRYSEKAMVEPYLEAFADLIEPGAPAHRPHLNRVNV